MTWLDELVSWRTKLTEHAAVDGEPPPSEEEVLRQLVYSAISDFVERDDFRLTGDLLDPAYQHEDAINEWVDNFSRSADRAAAAALDEALGG